MKLCAPLHGGFGSVKSVHNQLAHRKSFIFRPRFQMLIVRRVGLITCEAVRIGKTDQTCYFPSAGITDVRSICVFRLQLRSKPKTFFQSVGGLFVILIVNGGTGIFLEDCIESCCSFRRFHLVLQVQHFQRSMQHGVVRHQRS